MRIEFWNFKYEFNSDDAKIVVPIVLLLTAISFTTVNPIWLLISATGYFLILFFAKDMLLGAKSHITRSKMRCPKCKDKKLILQGYQPYKSDEHYPYYFCDKCKTTSILTEGGLLQI